MAKVTIKNKAVLRKTIDIMVNNRIKKSFKKLEASARKQESDYKASIRKGINPKTGRNYKGLKRETIERRKALAKVNKTHHKYRAGKASETFTGELVDAISFAVKSFKNKIRFNIRITGSHSRYTGVRGKKIGKRTNNSVIADAHEEMGRTLIGMSKQRAKQIITNLKAFIERG